MLTKLLVQVLIGAAVGYAYHRLSVAATGGGCPLTCNPWRAMAIGAVIGGLWPSTGRDHATVGRDVTALTQGDQQTMSVDVAEGVPVHITDSSFEGLVRGSRVPILLDAYADWCGPCRRLAPELETVARELSGKLTVAKLDVDTNPALAQALQIRGIPALFVIDDGKVVDAWSGFLPADDIVARLKPVVGGAWE